MMFDSPESSLPCTHTDSQKIAKLRAELESTAPVAGPSEWTAASELAEVEKLAEMGVIVRPGSQTKSKKGKGKQVPSGHVLFVDDRKDCKLTKVTSSLHFSSGLRCRKGADTGDSGGRGGRRGPGVDGA